MAGMSPALLRIALPIAALGAAILPSSAAAKCTAGTHKFEGSVQARTFCGPASTTLTAANSKVTIKGGECTPTKDYFTINIGTVVLGASKKTHPDYFGITVGKTPGSTGKAAGKDGTYKDGVVSVVSKGKSFSLTKSSITLKNGRTAGTFSGTSFEGGKVSGSFRCD